MLGFRSFFYRFTALIFERAFFWSAFSPISSSQAAHIDIGINIHIKIHDSGQLWKGQYRICVILVRPSKRWLDTTQPP
jgi:hypothetical protein